MGTRAFNSITKEKRMMDLAQDIINLHDIARHVEQEFGISKVSIDIRKCADRLNELVNPIPELESTAEGDQ